MMYLCDIRLQKVSQFVALLRFCRICKKRKLNSLKMSDEQILMFRKEGSFISNLAYILSVREKKGKQGF